MKKKLEELYKKKEGFEEYNTPVPQALLDKIAELEAISESTTPIYDTLKANYQYDNGIMPQEKKDCIESTVEQLLADVPNADEPGLLLGKIQCGKTDTFENIMGLAFDKGIDVIVVLTKGTIPLLEQTVSRLKLDYVYFKPNDDLDQSKTIRIHDIHDIKNGLKQALVDQGKTVIVCMKQDKNLKWLIDLFEKKSPYLKNKKVVVVDDEADFASRNYQNVRLQSKKTDDDALIVQEKETTLAKISKKIDQFRQLPKYCRYLQVTATPYSLYLQPNDELYLDGNKVLSFRPRFTTLVPTHPGYVGGEHYFVKSKNPDSMFSHLFTPITSKCIDVMGHEDKRYLREGVSSVNIFSLTYALTSYLMATAIRSIQQRAIGKQYNSCALIHVNTSKGDHDWQYKLVERLTKDIVNYVVNEDHSDLRVVEALDKAYSSYSESIGKGIAEGLISVGIPEKDEVIEEIKSILSTHNLHIQKVNSDEEVKSLLDEKGELTRDTTATVFIGGNVLDRGLTIKKMLCFFYGRDPRQQDSVLQHARFYGPRDMEDMAVTRLHTTNEIHSILSRMNDLDDQLRKWFIEGKDKNDTNAIFIGYDKRFQPCAPSKIKVSKIMLIKPQSRELPIGFWTGTRSQISATVKEIDDIIVNLPHYNEQDEDGFFEMDKDDAIRILHLIRDTYVYDDKHQNKDRKNDINKLIANLIYCTEKSDGKLYGLHRTDRNMSRLRSDNGGFIDAPDDGRHDLAPARAKAVNWPVLMLLRQNGKENKIDGVNYGWNNTPFYWPVLLPQENIETVMFATDQKPKEYTVVIDEKEILGDIDPAEVLRLVIKGDLVSHFGPEGTVSADGEYAEYETRELKETTASRYIYKDFDGQWELNPDIPVDEENYVGVYSYNDGLFPFVLKPYKYILLRNGRNAQSDAMLLELTDPEEWDTYETIRKNDDGDLLDSNDRVVYHASDIIRDKNLNEKEYNNETVCVWTIAYRIKNVLKFVPHAMLTWHDETLGEEFEDED